MVHHAVKNHPETLQGQKPYKLDDAQNLKFDPNHDMNCEVCEINEGKMDQFISGCFCSNPQNFAIGDTDTLSIIHNYAKNYAISDRYFQAATGASSMNDMYLARAQNVFVDNDKVAIGSIGSNCQYINSRSRALFEIYYDPSISHLLANCNFILKSYAEGYDYAKNNFGNNPCESNGYDSSDIPHGYYMGISDNPIYMADYSSLKNDFEQNKLNDVSFVKPIGYNSAHPVEGKITDENKFIQKTVDMVLNSNYAEDTLII